MKIKTVCETCDDDLVADIIIHNEDIVISLEICQSCLESEKDDSYGEGEEVGNDESYEKGYAEGYKIAQQEFENKEED